MRVLMVDKYYFIKGGAERYLFELGELLRSKGHDVVPFSMEHPRNFPTPYAKYFVSQIEFNGLHGLRTIKEGFRILARVVYSTEAKRAIEKLIEEVKPDVAHLHMIDHQLSPSILEPLKRRGIPVVQTCHQYKHVCPSYRLFLMDKQEICERCLGGRFYHAILQRCHKSSLAASSIVAVESYVHRALRVYDSVDRFHVPSRFLGSKLIEAGFPPRKVWHTFYTIDVSKYPYSPNESDYYAYFGRISEEKGILTLLKAAEQVPQAKLVIVGEGPYRPQVEKFIEDRNLNNVFVLGRKDGKELLETIGLARFVVVPSEWYENSPLVIYESFSMGKPVIASRIGGMPELVDHGRNGFLFEPKDYVALANLIGKLWENRRLRLDFGAEARAKAEREFAFEAHYPRIAGLYEELLGGS